MDFLNGMDTPFFNYFILPLLIFLARISDQTIGTMRLIYASKGMKYIAPIVGFFESLNFHIFSLDGAAFTRETWERPPPCWEFYAIPTERLSMVERLPAFAKMVLDRYS